MQVVFLGCSDEQGVPRIGCECEVCRSALLPGSRNHRTGSSIALCYGRSYAERLVLIDAAPEFRLQATNCGLRQFDALLLTHCDDASIVGLGPLLKSQRGSGLPLQVYAPSPVLEALREQFHYLWIGQTYRRILHLQPLDDPIDLWGLAIHPMRIDHGIEGTAFGYQLRIGQRRLAYIPAMLRPTAEVQQALMGLDLLMLGTSHYYDDTELWKRSIMDIMTARELISQAGPEQAVLTHLSHTVDYDKISNRLWPGTSLAYDGLTVEIPE
jgi:phosphoribosyl 1,2-cyclic phosphate phosphodiesterase